MARTRNLERSRERILAAALKEFAARGFAGARTRSIARRGRISEQMIFHCFGNKERLYRAVVNGEIGRMGSALAAHESMDLATHLTAGFERAATEDRDSLRLWQWEALEANRRTLAAENERRSLLRAEVAQLRREKLRGDFPSDLDDGLMLMATLGLRLIPVLLPQLVPLITGLPSEDPRFRRTWADFLRTVSEKLADRAAPGHERAGNASAAQARGDRRRR